MMRRTPTIANSIHLSQADSCAVCQCQAGQQGRTLAVSLALEGKADPYAIDRLIAGFEVRLFVLHTLATLNVG